MYRLKLFVCHLSIPDKYSVKMIDSFAYHGFSATVCVHQVFKRYNICMINQRREMFQNPALV